MRGFPSVSIATDLVGSRIGNGLDRLLCKSQENLERTLDVGHTGFLIFLLSYELGSAVRSSLIDASSVAATWKHDCPSPDAAPHKSSIAISYRPAYDG